MGERTSQTFGDFASTEGAVARGRWTHFTHKPVFSFDIWILGDAHLMFYTSATKGQLYGFIKERLALNIGPWIRWNRRSSHSVSISIDNRTVEKSPKCMHANGTPDEQIWVGLAGDQEHWGIV